MGEKTAWRLQVNIIQNWNKKMKDPQASNDNTLVHSLTLRMENGHKPVERKARGKNGATPRWWSECTDNVENLHVVPWAMIVQHNFPQRV